MVHVVPDLAVDAGVHMRNAVRDRVAAARDWKPPSWLGCSVPVGCVGAGSVRIAGEARKSVGIERALVLEEGMAQGAHRHRVPGCCRFACRS
jgi:hypothetical protein